MEERQLCWMKTLSSWTGITALTLAFLLGLSNCEDSTMSTDMMSSFNTTIAAEPLRCYSCQSEVANSDCVHMNNTDNVPTQVCAPTDLYCKVQHFSGNNTFRYVNRTCSAECKGGCVQAAGSGDFIFLEMCYYCCQDNLCNTRNAAVLQSCMLSIPLMLVCLCSLFFTKR